MTTPRPPSPLKRGTILALSSGTRSIGIAVADSLGIEHARVRFLRINARTMRELAGLNHWIISLITRFDPEYLVLDRLSFHRDDARNQMLHGYLRAALNAHHTVPIRELSRQEAITWLCRTSPSHMAGRQPSIRLAAVILHEGWHENFLEHIPAKRYRTGWDRTWEQVVAAMCLALYARDDLHDPPPTQPQLPLPCRPGP